MTPEERARKLRKEADVVLKMINLERHCARIGQVIPTGSYFMDLMMYPDIDLYIPYTNIKDIFALAAKLAQYDSVAEIVFQKGSSIGWRKELAKGYYLKPIIEYGKWGRPWKVDTWSLPNTVVEKKLRELQDLKDRMTGAQKNLILNYKYSILTEKGRTPMFSGIFIYQAVINKSMTKYRDITKYLISNGIKMI
jgi:hypothetical protein